MFFNPLHPVPWPQKSQNFILTHCRKTSNFVNGAGVVGILPPKRCPKSLAVCTSNAIVGADCSYLIWRFGFMLDRENCAVSGNREIQFNQIMTTYQQKGMIE